MSRTDSSHRRPRRGAHRPAPTPRTIPRAGRCVLAVSGIAASRRCSGRPRPPTRARLDHAAEPTEQGYPGRSSRASAGRPVRPPSAAAERRDGLPDVPYGKQFGPVTATSPQAAICQAVAKFQQWAQVPVQNGVTDAVTAKVARNLVATNPASCNAGSAATVCVDLSHQILWMCPAARSPSAPVPVRTGKAKTPLRSGITRSPRRRLTRSPASTTCRCHSGRASIRLRPARR